MLSAFGKMFQILWNAIRLSLGGLPTSLFFIAQSKLLVASSYAVNVFAMILNDSLADLISKRSDLISKRFTCLRRHQPLPLTVSGSVTFDRLPP